ncbi:MAG TPA: MFS transporter [Burkholderiaceae bacterium]|nr:MFS transporter [Burkholderiaceae bacterium]
MTILPCILLVVSAHIVFTGARVTSSLYALANGASTFTVGVLMALFALVPMLTAVRAGKWLDRVGPLRPLAAASSLILAGIVLPAAFPYPVADLGPLLVGVALIGTGQMLAQITVQDLVGRSAAPDERTIAFSWLALGVSVSGFTGPVSAGFIIDTLGHRAAFATFSVVTLAMFGLLAWLWRDLPGPMGARSADEERPFFDLLRAPPVRNVLLTTTLISMAWDLQTFMVPVHGTRVGLTASQIGLVLGSFAVATFTIRLAMPWLSRTYHEWQVLTFTLFTAALAFVVMPLLDSLLPLAGCAFLLGLGLGAAQPNVMSLLHEHSPTGRVGEALGLRTTIMNSSHVVLPLVFGAAGAVIGAASVFWIMAMMLAGGGYASARRLHNER